MNEQSVKAIRPEDIGIAKVDFIPPVVFEVFNQLIARHYCNGKSTVKQAAVIDKLVGHGYTREEIFRNHWLDVESVYEEAGWRVQYENPGYNESGEAFFTFTSKPRAHAPEVRG